MFSRIDSKGYLYFMYDQEGHPQALAKVFYFPLIYVSLILMTFFALKVLDIEAGLWGIYPRKIETLIHILSFPFIHKDLTHLVSNCFPLLFLMAALFYFYPSRANRILFFIYLLSGAGTWLIGRESFHIGASGIVYGLAFFIFFGGVFTRHTGLMASGLLIVFMYGGMVWFMFPVDPMISWEGHLSGALSGIALSFFFRKSGPKRKVYDWEIEEEEEKEKKENETIIRYLYREKDSANHTNHGIWKSESSGESGFSPGDGKSTDAESSDQEDKK